MLVTSNVWVRKLNEFEERASIRLEDMECHFTVVWCNFRVEDQFNQIFF
jgi:hypothetical protein